MHELTPVIARSTRDLSGDTVVSVSQRKAHVNERKSGCQAVEARPVLTELRSDWKSLSVGENLEEGLSRCDHGAGVRHGVRVLEVIDDLDLATVALQCPILTTRIVPIAMDAPASQQSSLGIGFNCALHRGQEIRMPLVVGVQERYMGVLGQCNSGISRRTHARVRLRVDHDARVLVVALNHFFAGVAGTVVDDDDLEVFEALRQDGIQASPDGVSFVVQGDDHGEHQETFLSNLARILNLCAAASMSLTTSDRSDRDIPTNGTQRRNVAKETRST